MKPNYFLFAGGVLGLLLGSTPSVSAQVKSALPSVLLAQTAPQPKPLEAQPEAMTPQRLDTLLRGETSDIRGQNNQWQLIIDGQQVLVLVDEERDRMRIVAPVIPAAQLNPEQVGNVLIANFHTALDARYAVTDGLLVAAFMHPLSSLQENNLRSALSQVVKLAQNFGTSYSSEGLSFGATQAPAPEPSFRLEGESEI